MIEIKFQGRGGQGVVVASEILARASFEEDMYPQCFSIFGGERRGAPVAAFVRIDKEKIHLKCDIDSPDHLVLFDENLIDPTEIPQHVAKEGIVLLNSHKDIGKGIPGNLKVGRIDALGISQRNEMGAIINTAMLGAYVGLSHIVQLDTLLDVIKDNSPGDVEKNLQAAKDAFEALSISK